MPADRSPADVRRGVVAVILENQRFLVIRRSPQVRAGGRICFPGGHIEAGESAEEALCRELREELDLAVLPRRCLWESVTGWGVQLQWWRAELAAPASPRPNPLEVAEVLWRSVDELRCDPDLLSSNHAFLKAWAKSPEWHA